jgi:hypothetical protein
MRSGMAAILYFCLSANKKCKTAEYALMLSKAVQFYENLSKYSEADNDKTGEE